MSAALAYDECMVQRLVRLSYVLPISAGTDSEVLCYQGFEKARPLLNYESLVRSAMGLCECCAMSGTEIAYGGYPGRVLFA
eukprot:2672645-Rhodomonas_salina.3